MPYTDYGGFGPAYFGAASDGTVHPAGYSEYTDLPFDFSLIATELQNTGEPLGIVGCGYGYTIDHLRAAGLGVYGMDISDHAVSQANADGVIQGDVLSQSDVTAFADLAHPQMRWLATEALLSCLTDSEAVTACENLRAEAQKGVAHVVWTDPHPDYYNKKTLAEWQALCDPDGVDEWFDFNDLQNYWERE